MYNLKAARDEELANRTKELDEVVRRWTAVQHRVLSLMTARTAREGSSCSEGSGCEGS